MDEEDDPELYDAIMASLVNPEDSRNGKTIDPKELEEDRRLLKEVMQLSKLEDAKNKGKLNLDHLKRNNKKPDEHKSHTLLPEPSQAALQ